MKYFTEDYLQFFIELAANNHKEWFDENRKRYEKSVKDPFKKFVDDLITETRKFDPSVTIEAKDAIFRINRDIRFSKDKTPYKLDRSAIISSAGRKDHSVPGFYISLGPEHTSIGGGAYFLKPDQLTAMRQHIVNHPKEFEKLLKDETFNNHFDGIKGEENKRLPKEFQEAGEGQPLLYKKQFYFMRADDPELILKDNFMDYCIENFKAAQPVQQFLKEGMGA
jgi:uncharacterized protein (TIGR02453 family)